VHPGGCRADFNPHTLWRFRLIPEIPEIPPTSRRLALPRRSLVPAKIIPPRTTTTVAFVPRSSSAATEITANAAATLASSALVAIPSAGSFLTRLELAPLILGRCGFVDVSSLGPCGSQG
jgi:hypothetical protein